MAIQEGDKSRVVVSLNEMDQFVNENVFKTSHGLLREFEVERYTARGWITRAPLGFHSANAPGCSAYAEEFLPLLEERSCVCLKLFAVPATQHMRAFVRVAPWLGVNFDRVIAHLYPIGPRAGDQFEPVASSKKIVALAAQHFSAFFTGLCGKGRALLLDPAKLGNYRDSHGRV